jgi:hypothetical protein
VGARPIKISVDNCHVENPRQGDGNATDGTDLQLQVNTARLSPGHRTICPE